MSNIFDILNELKKFSKEIVTIGKPLVHQDVTDFEEKYNLKLPKDFKFFLKSYNGFSLMGTEILGFNRDNESIDSVYQYEHELVSFRQYNYLVPFHNDGRGNFYCLDTRGCNMNSDTCQIIFWVSNYIYTETDQPEITHNGFSDFVQEVIIEWTLEDYDYNGNPK